MSTLNSGIYLIRVKNSNHSYVGASTVLDERMKASRYAVRRRLRVKIEDVQCEVLERIPVEENRGCHRVNLLWPLRPREQYWIHKLNPSLNIIHKRKPIEPVEFGIHLASA